MFPLISRSLAKVTYMEFDITLFLYFPMDFIFVLQPFRSLKISSDIFTNILLLEILT
jgi:hypothetical protein